MAAAVTVMVVVVVVVGSGTAGLKGMHSSTSGRCKGRKWGSLGDCGADLEGDAYRPLLIDVVSQAAAA